MSEKEATTPDLVEPQNRLTDLGSRRDLDATTVFFAPDAVWDMSPIGMGLFDGQAATRGVLEGWFASYEEYELEAEEILDLGSGVGLRMIVQKGRPVGSSGEVQLRNAAVGA